MDFNSAFGFGELVYLRANGHPDNFFEERPLNRSLAGGVIIPIGLDGLSFNLEGTAARTTPRAAGGVQAASEFERVSARLRYPWLRSRDVNFTSELVFDAQEEQALLNVGGTFAALSFDRLRIFRVNNDASWFAPWGGTFSGRLTPSFGVSGLGARTAAEADPLLPLSRQGADADFEKLEGFAAYTQQIVEHLAVDLRVRGQTSFNQPLLNSELFGIANPQGLSAFDSGTIVGDFGYVARGELQSPWPIAVPGGAVLIAPYVFGAVGEVHRVQPTALEASLIRAASQGVGVRFAGAPTGSLSGANLTLEYAVGQRGDGLPDTNRFNVIGAVRF